PIPLLAAAEGLASRKFLAVGRGQVYDKPHCSAPPDRPHPETPEEPVRPLPAPRCLGWLPADVPTARPAGGLGLGDGGRCGGGAAEGEKGRGPPRAGVLWLLPEISARGVAPRALWRTLPAQEQKEVAALGGRLNRHFRAGEFERAARLAEQIAAFRAQRQGRG